MPKSKKELDKDLMFQKIMPALSDNPFSDLHEGAEAGSEKEAVPQPPVPSAPASADVPVPPPAAPAPVPAPAAPTVWEESELPPLDDAQEDDLSALRSRLFAHSSFLIEQENVCTVNVMEAAVRKSADVAMRRFNCCGCDRCRCDVITGALNLLPPRYVTGDIGMIDQYVAELPEKDVMAALVRAVISVRAHPNH